MADKDVYLNFGADVGGLEAQMVRAQAMVRATANEMRSLAVQMQKTGATADSEMGQKLAALGERLAQGKGLMASTRDELGKIGGAAKVAAEGIGEVGKASGFNASQTAESIHVVKALFDEIAAGQDPIRAVAMEGGRIMQILSGGGLGMLLTGWGALAAAVAGVAVTLGMLVYSGMQARQAIASIQLDAAAEGFTLTAQQAERFRDEIKQLAGVGDSEAEKILKPFLAMGQVGGVVAAMMSPALKELAKTMDGDLVKAAESVAERFVDLDGKGKKYVEDSKSLTRAEKDHYTELLASGRLNEARIVIVEASSRALIANKKAVDDAKDSEENHKMALVVAANAGLTVEEAEKRIAASMKEAGDAADTETGALQRLAEELRKTSSAADTFARAMNAAGKINTVGSAKKKLEEEIGVINAGIAVAPDAKSREELQRALGMANEKLKPLQQQDSDPKGIGRDLTQQDQDALTHYDNVFRGSEAARLQGHIAMLRQMLASDQLNAAQKFKLNQDLEASEKQLYDSQTKAGEKSGTDTLGAAQASIEGQIRAIEDQTRLVTDHLAAQVKLKQITAQQGEAATVAALKRESEQVEALYAKELALAGLSLTKKQEIKNREIALADRIALQEQQIQDRTEQAILKSYTSIADTMAGVVNSQVDGMLRGTTSIKQAIANMASSAIVDIVKFGIKWAAEQVAMTAAHATAVATQTATTAAGVATQKAMNLTTVQGDAGRAAAGAYAAIAGIPLIGPVLAPAAAAVAYAGTMAFASMDIGAYNVPHDMPALIHRNELVMPAREAGALRDMLSAAPGAGGGQGGSPVNVNPSTHFHVNAIDGASVAGFFRANQTQLMRAIDEAVRHGAHLGLRRVAAV